MKKNHSSYDPTNGRLSFSRCLQNLTKMCIPVFLKISEPALWIVLLILPLQFYSTAEIPWPGVKQPGKLTDCLFLFNALSR